MVKFVNRKNYIFYIFALIAFAMFFCVAGLSTYDSEHYAYAAEEPVTLISLKGTRLKKIEGTRAEFYAGVDYDADIGYFSKVAAIFGVSTDYYLISYKINGEVRAENRIEATIDGQVAFYAEETGIYEVTCSAYLSELDSDPIGECTVQFKNDASKPICSDSVVAPMGEWKQTGSQYTAVADWSNLTDTESGIKEIRYWLEYETGGSSDIYLIDVLTAGKTDIVIDKSCFVCVICYDAAGNGINLKYAMDKFDDDPPPMPIYTITPILEPEKFANRYEITVTFLEDNGNSGIADRQFYTISGELDGTDADEYKTVTTVTKYFEAVPPTPESIILDKPMDYVIKLYAMDRAGNLSLPLEINVPSTAFDVYAPDVINNPMKTIDLFDADGICTVGLYVSDKNESGVASVATEDGKITFVKGVESDYYYAKFDCLDYPEKMTLILSDTAGNIRKYVMPFSYFNDSEINAAVEKSLRLIRSEDLSQYTSNAQSEIISAVEKLSTMLSVENSAKYSVITAATDITSAYDKNIACNYTIMSSPTYASSNMSFTPELSDFAAYKKGSVISVAISSWDNDVDYRNKTEFGTAFSDAFRLAITYSEEDVQVSGDALSTGILVEMSKPVEYLDRNFVLVNADTGDIVPIEIKNDKICFRLKKDTNFVLVIEGGKAPTGSQKDKPKEISVFGNKLPLATFLGIVCGCGGVALLLIVGLVVLKKVRG